MHWLNVWMLSLFFVLSLIFLFKYAEEEDCTAPNFVVKFLMKIKLLNWIELVYYFVNFNLFGKEKSKNENKSQK